MATSLVLLLSILIYFELRIEFQRPPHVGGDFLHLLSLGLASFNHRCCKSCFEEIYLGSLPLSVLSSYPTLVLSYVLFLLALVKVITRAVQAYIASALLPLLFFARLSV